jgi:hypothetical protein
MMKVAKCMEEDSMCRKAGMPLLLQLNTRVNIINATQTASGLKRG